MALPNKQLFITGANRGIGLALTRAYLTAGWEVDATCRKPSEAYDLQELAHTYPKLSLSALDVTDHQAINALSAKLKDRKYNLVINNAGYFGPKGYGFGNTDVGEWRKVLETNTIAPLKIAEAFYPQLRAGSPGVFAALSSKVGSMTENTAGGGYIYRSSKAALNSVVKSLSNDLSPEGIIAVALHPGWVQTEMGGPNALISTETSVEGLVNVLTNLSLQDSGKFLNVDGTEIPW
ncbi:SDR family oxidoreductase [Enterovibrio sp. ZSDZ35]|uniref:SDR family oxidoreductase n=1 Tax=Enterovibrio qingdaonensis TaxID=2899818 RepID=A0ABT5QQ69_9GAMM|nr:SDR family oxidoreductase [Enterovibrio sp. ZSDZ35]MDD1783126.1 SDR family oxidoreductase [Enterovibrio sp. ZSDZ35]